MTDKALSISDLQKTYPGNVKALKGISLTVKKGQFFGLLGPNGAGKSTLIHIIMGLVLPTKGSASVFGNDVVKDYKISRRLAGYAPQDINLDWFLTVEQTLDFHAGYYGMNKAERAKRIDELLEIFSLQDKRNSKTMALSGGMKRRVTLARALMHRPESLILDEPTAGVDIELRRDLWEYMKKINAEGTTIILTTHYIEEAEELCDNIALINHGKIIKSGTKSQLKKAYNTRSLETVYLKMTSEDKKK
jgi:ABC-2 type transport system ATP-binding protein